MEFGTALWGVVYILTILSFPYLAWLAWSCEQKKKQDRWPKEEPDFLSYWEEKNLDLLPKNGR